MIRLEVEVGSRAEVAWCRRPACVTSSLLPSRARTRTGRCPGLQDRRCRSTFRSRCPDRIGKEDRVAPHTRTVTRCPPRAGPDCSSPSHVRRAGTGWDQGSPLLCARRVLERAQEAVALVRLATARLRREGHLRRRRIFREHADDTVLDVVVEAKAVVLEVSIARPRSRSSD